jgi:hypothetical protein
LYSLLTIALRGLRRATSESIFLGCKKLDRFLKKKLSQIFLRELALRSFVVVKVVLQETDFAKLRSKNKIPKVFSKIKNVFLKSILVD